MEENSKSKNIKNRVIIALICIMVVGAVAGVSTVLYNIFYNNNIKSIQTISNNDNEEKSIEDDTISVELEKDQEEIIEISEEEKAKIEEEERKQEEEQERKRQEEEKKKQEQKNRISNYPYYIKVNYTANTVTVYSKDSNGNYTVPVRAMVCSTGKATPTSGVYKTPNKYRWKLLIGNSYGQYSTRITGQILFHSVPYERQSEDSLITRYYDRLGITTSLGCIRLTVIDAKWIYDNCPIGTSVEFYSSSNPGPLGKPTAKKITDYGSPLNRWDPTDPNPNNPWKTQNENNNKNNNDNTNTNNNVNNNTNNNKDNNANNNTDNNKNNTTNTENNTNTNPDTNKSKKITVENVVGKTESEAKKILENLTIKIEYKSDNTKNNGIVLSQTLKAGSSVEKGTSITLTINKIQETKDGTININVKSLTGYIQQKDEDENIIPPKKILLKVDVDDKEVYNKEVLEDTENVDIKVKGINIVSVKIYIDGKLKKETQLNFNESNAILKVK